MLWCCCCRSEHEETQALSPGTETARQGFGTAPALPMPVSYFLLAFHFMNRTVMFIPHQTILAKIYLCYKTKSNYLCNGADWKIAAKLDLQCRQGVEVFGFKADNLYGVLSLRSVSLRREVWL